MFKNALDGWIALKDEEFFRSRINTLSEIYAKVVITDGNYFDYHILHGLWKFFFLVKKIYYNIFINI